MAPLIVKEEALIPRPIEDVFDRAIDIDGYSKWMPRLGIFIECRQTSSGPVQTGTTLDDRGRLGTFRGEVIELERPAKVVFNETLRWFKIPVMEARLEYRFTPTPAGTEVRHTATARLFGIFRAMRPWVAVLARGERRRTVRALKASLTPA